MKGLPIFGMALLVGACAAPARVATTLPLPDEPSRSVPTTRVAITAGLPAIPPVSGRPIAIQLRHPGDNQLLTTRDSNFVFGSVGSGDVRLTINGTEVPVAPNGAFLAWVANPPLSAPRYELVAVRDRDSVQRVVRVRYASRVMLPAGGRLRVDSSSVLPARGWWARDGEFQRVSVRAPRNAQVTVVGRDAKVWPVPVPVPVPMPVAGSASTPAPLTDSTDVAGVFMTDVPAWVLGDSAKPALVVIARGADTVRLPVPVGRVLPASERVMARLRTGSLVGSDTDRVVYARATPDGVYKWMLFPGTLVEVAGRVGSATRVRLDAMLDVWVANSDLELLPAGTPSPRRVTGGFRLTPSAEWVDVAIPIGERVAHQVESDGNRLILTLYGAQADPEISAMLGNDALVRRFQWEQVTSDRVRVEFILSQPVFGWLSIWDDARRAYVLRIRRAPAVDAKHPLRGLTIAVDPGHPPAGATGPTGLYEGDAVFPVAQLVVNQLQALGANAFSTRASLAALGLPDRAVAARRANAHAFVSLHLNALPDGVNPFTANGTSTLFYHSASEPFARIMQRALMARFGLRDLGVHYQDLAVARPTWYPSVLTEGLFLMIPEQEAAMRDAGFQKKYAEAVVEGLVTYFSGMARR
ncbi:MAG: hypothetical protein RLZZ621_1833 [Gemmatimonadota bacterium]